MKTEADQLPNRFSPPPVEKKVDYSALPGKSIQAYIQRQFNAREMKREKQSPAKYFNQPDFPKRGFVSEFGKNYVN